VSTASNRDLIGPPMPAFEIAAPRHVSRLHFYPEAKRVGYAARLRKTVVTIPDPPGNDALIAHPCMVSSSKKRRRSIFRLVAWSGSRMPALRGKRTIASSIPYETSFGRVRCPAAITATAPYCCRFSLLPAHGISASERGAFHSRRRQIVQEPHMLQAQRCGHRTSIHIPSRGSLACSGG